MPVEHPLPPTAVDAVGPDLGPAAAPRPGRRGPGRELMSAVAVIAVGGALGAVARYGAALAWPVAPDAFPWTTLLVNALGCAVIGVFLTLITEVRTVHPLVRPFFGTGVLGGFTTFSTYTVDVQRLVLADRAPAALAYLAATVAAALVAVWAGAASARPAFGRRPR
ncbi:fluoride efflux transporter CrcB [Kitasatospora sp. NPDC057692]|uniref:fluoride efflux transporter CrcB n=1 Tax=Kitasatospora sp. NPDC057692 TaxID=3346215 RepID=UPI003686D3C0